MLKATMSNFVWDLASLLGQARGGSRFSHGREEKVTCFQIDISRKSNGLKGNESLVVNQIFEKLTFLYLITAQNLSIFCTVIVDSETSVPIDFDVCFLSQKTLSIFASQLFYVCNKNVLIGKFRYRLSVYTQNMWTCPLCPVPGVWATWTWWKCFREIFLGTFTHLQIPRKLAQTPVYIHCILYIYCKRWKQHVCVLFIYCEQVQCRTL